MACDLSCRSKAPARRQVLRLVDVRRLGRLPEPRMDVSRWSAALAPPTQFIKRATSVSHVPQIRLR